MAAGRGATILRLLKPIIAGVALAYLVTAFVDKPAPVHFQPENPYAARQEEIVEPQATLVTEKNIMKLGSPLSVTPQDLTTNNPLAPLEGMEGSDNSIPSLTAKGTDQNATRVIRKGVEEVPAMQ